MKIIAGCSFLMLLFFSGQALGNQACEIELADGGVILGELISKKDGIYKIHSESLGTLSVKESEIRSIRFKSHFAESTREKESADNPESGMVPEMESLRKSMMNDRDVMDRIRSLESDPQMQELLNDPEFMNAIQSGDIQTLMSHPKFIELLNNPDIREIQKKVLNPQQTVE